MMCFPSMEFNNMHRYRVIINTAINWILHSCSSRRLFKATVYKTKFELEARAKLKEDDLHIQSVWTELWSEEIKYIFPMWTFHELCVHPGYHHLLSLKENQHFELRCVSFRSQTPLHTIHTPIYYCGCTVYVQNTFLYVLYPYSRYIWRA